MKLPISSGTDLHEYMFEEWHYFSFKMFDTENIIIKEVLKDIESFNDKEQEIIYALCHGFISDKDILNHFDKFNIARTAREVNYTIGTLHSKFETNNLKFRSFMGTMNFSINQ